MENIIPCIWRWLQSQFVQSDLASWLAVVIALGAAVLAWKVLHPVSYIEFHPNWDVDITDGIVTVKGNISLVSPAAYIEVLGSIKLDKEIVLLNRKYVSPTKKQNEHSITLEGKYAGASFKGGNSLLKLKATLSDGSGKRFKEHQLLEEVKPSPSVSDKGGFQP